MAVFFGDMELLTTRISGWKAQLYGPLDAQWLYDFQTLYAVLSDVLEAA